ncbi:hypothetical protein KFL_000820240 [Klebsormidium nitens]|uniref:ER-bound oxygenase mpaB/mpaB'/Rubber oxygenase catalytic domain-containing protein n=1 Tax=Klebsormidium nitens TaxID=105231 RepID=A0A1Y1HYB2_KLENI|nr:hypothetical protein KFL_000820240 [Klebsormidium nitens]|eukprot:GAQ81516.1 hypothetical protein KFL_000820240 [Klebsormidium nitens]
MAAVVVLTLQIMLTDPVLRQALQKHSRFQKQPLVRILRTMTAFELVARGSAKERRKVAEWIKRIHGGIGGSVSVNGSTQPYGFTKALQTWVLASLAQANLCFQEEMLATRGLGKTADEIVARTMLFQRRLADVGLEELPLDRAQLEAYMEERKRDLDYCRGKQDMAADVTTAKRQGAESFVGWWPGLSLHVYILFTSLSYRLLYAALTGQAKSIHRAALKCLKVTYHFWAALTPPLTPRGLFALSCTAVPSLFPAFVEVYQEILGCSEASETDAREFLFGGVHDASTLDHLLEPSLTPLARLARLPKIFLVHFWKSCAAAVDRIRLRFLWAELNGMKGRADSSVPVHLGVISDGNRRFARKLGKDPLYGHTKGSMKSASVFEWAFLAGIEYLTIWIFSDDNFKRSRAEVDGLMRIFEEECEDKLYDGVLYTYHVRVLVIGDRSKLPESTQKAVARIEAATAHNRGRTLVVAMAYGGRGEIAAAVRVSLQGLKGAELEERVGLFSEKDIDAHTHCARLGLPPVDAILRTSGERRLSGFMLWDSAYCELAFVPRSWPELTECDFVRALLDLSKRARRKGQ